jgi:sugar lactone lactonase YvrE
MKEHSFEKHTAALVLDARATLGEGALWCPRERVLYWVDIEGKKLHRYDPANRQDGWLAMPTMVSSVVPVAEGGLLVSLEHSIIRLHWSLGSYRVLASIEPDKPRNRCNDGKCDPAGRYWIGTMHLETEAGAGACTASPRRSTPGEKAGWRHHLQRPGVVGPTGGACTTSTRPRSRCKSWLSTTIPALWARSWAPFPCPKQPGRPTA